MNKLFYGDNLDILPWLANGSVDLVYLDPPFNSNRSYNVIFARHGGIADSAAQIEVFDDTWHWTPVTDGQYQRYVFGGELPSRVADALTAFRTLLLGAGRVGEFRSAPPYCHALTLICFCWTASKPLVRVIVATSTAPPTPWFPATVQV
jgi:hypothetical protein